MHRSVSALGLSKDYHSLFALVVVYLFIKCANGQAIWAFLPVSKWPTTVFKA